MNYLSRPQGVQSPVEMGGNLQLAVQVANSLQSRYDSNKAAVDQTIAQYEGLRGLTDTDNAYIASQVANVKNQVNQLGSINLAYSSGRDTILNNLKSVLKDPIVTDILVSKANKDNYDAQYSKIVEKDPSKRSAANYEYGLTQGGYYDYINGKTKKVGGMSYRPYEDVQANYTKRLKEYVDQYDDEQLLAEGKQLEGSKYHTVDIYGKKVLKEDLENFIKQTTTPQEAEQLNINAWYKFKDLDEAAVASILKPSYETRLANLKLQEAGVKAQADSGDKLAKQKLKTIQNTIEEQASRIRKGNYSKQDLYSEYNNEFISNMASLYDKNTITKKDIDDTLFQEQKFETDKMQWSLTFDQKERELALKQKEAGLQESALNGTLTEYPTTLEDKPESEFKSFIKEKDTAFKNVSDALSTVDGKFAQMNSREKATYLANLNLSDPSKIKEKNITPAMRDSIIKWQKLTENASNFYADNLKVVQPTIIGSFQDMQNSYFNDKNSELALDKVAAYLPNTTRVIKNAKKSGKQFTWADVAEDDRYAIQAEFLAQYRREGNLNEDQTKVFATNEYIVKNKIKNKSIVANLDKIDKERRDIEKGYIETGWEGVKSLAGNVGTFFKRAGAGVEGLYNLAKEGEEYANKQEQLRQKDPSYKYDTEELKKTLNFITPEIMLPLSISRTVLAEEENLRNIESRDLLGRENIAKRFDTYKETMKEQMTNKFGTESPFQKYSKAVSYSTDIKEQKNTANLIKQTILATNPDAPAPEGDNYIVKQKGTGFEVTYQIKEDKKFVNAPPVTLDKLPTQLQSMFQQKQDDWQKSIYNPNFKVPSFTIETPQTSEEATEAFNNLVTYGKLDRGIQDALYTSDIFLPAATYVNNNVSKEVKQRNKEAIENFKKQKFKTNTEIVNGNLFSKIVYRDIVSGEIIEDRPIKHNLYNEQVEDIDIQLTLLQRVDQLKKEQLAKLD